MRQNIPNVLLFVVLAGVLTAGAWYIDKTYFPKPTPKPARESLMAIGGAALAPTSPALDWPMRVYTPPAAPSETKPEAAKPAVAVPPKPSAPAEFVALGGADCFNEVLLTTRGAGVIQLRLPKFDEANRLGAEVRDADKKPHYLTLIPGVKRARSKDTLTEPNGGLYEPLKPGSELQDGTLGEASYVLLHYVSEDDPLRQGADADQLNDKYPSPELAERIWEVAEKSTSAEGVHKVVMETTLAAPYFLKLRKTFTLQPKDYHVGMQLEVIPLPGRAKDKGRFRYQIVGPRGMPVEGEWYAMTYRNVLTGYRNAKGGARRAIDDSATIHAQHGGTLVPKGENTFTYAAVGSQYFASALAIDNTQPQEVRSGIWDYVRPTREPQPWDSTPQIFMADVTFRAVSMQLNPAPTETITHKYMIYNGPIKVRLLKQLSLKGKEAEVSEELVDRYLDQLTLNTMTDYHSPYAISRFANAIYFTDIVIFFTNLMHGLLGFLHGIVPVWGLNILMLTVLVKSLLFLPSRKQQMTMAKMGAVNAALKPEFDKLAEKYKDDPSTLQREKTALLLKNGVNPVATMGGCFLIFAQMPIFMGLYFCLQESIFFRLEPFLWFNSLASPDMTIWWTEQIPFVSAASSMGGSFSVYLGPYFNILPLIAVGLIFLQQWISMPPAVDEQMQMQQKMMKFMVIIMALFFYKSPAGLCLYFICSSLWGLLERKLIKKPDIKIGAVNTGAPQPLAAKSPTEPEAPRGFFGRLAARVEELQKEADSQSQRQIRNSPQAELKKKKKKK
ncbi:MAG: YidC/Oxa1 family insertase periplasmic-domain containing protein [Fimbriiglobus sp.]